MVVGSKGGVNWVGGKGGERVASVKLGVVPTCLLAIGFFLPLRGWKTPIFDRKFIFNMYRDLVACWMVG